MKCLVTGATGFIGRECCRRLLEEGHGLVACSRTGAPLPGGVSTLAVDLSRDLPDPALLAGVDCVFHAAGIAHRHARPGEYERVNHRATLQLAHAARDAGVGCFVFLSSVKAMGAPAGERPRGEGDGAQPDDPYGLSKWRAEQGLRREFDGGGMAVYILRPALVYGRGAAGNLGLLARAVGRGLPRPPAGGARSMIAREDLVGLMLVAGGRAEPGVHTWIAADGEAYSTRRIYDALRAARGLGPGRAWCPRWLWRLGAALLDVLSPREEPAWQRLFGTELYSNQRACVEAHWRPGLRLEDTLSAPGAGAP